MSIPLLPTSNPSWVQAALYALAALILAYLLLRVLPVLIKVLLAIVVLFIGFWALGHILPLLGR